MSKIKMGADLQVTEATDGRDNYRMVKRLQKKVKDKQNRRPLNIREELASDSYIRR